MDGQDVCLHCKHTYNRQVICATERLSYVFGKYANQPQCHIVHALLTYTWRFPKTHKLVVSYCMQQFSLDLRALNPMVKWTWHKSKLWFIYSNPSAKLLKGYFQPFNNYIDVMTNLRDTQDTSQMPWPCNCESPKESVRRPSQHTSKIM